LTFTRSGKSKFHTVISRGGNGLHRFVKEKSRGRKDTSEEKKRKT